MAGVNQGTFRQTAVGGQVSASIKSASKRTVDLSHIDYTPPHSSKAPPLNV